jgi:hypothetical protein
VLSNWDALQSECGACVQVPEDRDDNETDREVWPKPLRETVFGRLGGGLATVRGTVVEGRELVRVAPGETVVVGLPPPDQMTMP